MTWLVTGGAGYIGAHVVHAMVAAGERVVVLDDLSTGDAGRLDGLPAVPLVVGSVRDRGLVRRVLREHGVRGVVHVAGKKQVAESVADPLTYYAENVAGLVALLEGCRAKGVTRFVFSSSAAVYGTPDVDPVPEDAPCRPLSPYGRTKLAGEWLLRDCAAAWGLAATSLRYFNVAGAAHPRLGDTGAANLVPLVFAALDAGHPPVVLGDDHATPDGTGVRDYVHVADVAAAHLAAAR
ncbi:NAD-dependent epimerase/dehydratase family protein, partial [Modestobacter versicolor]